MGPAPGGFDIALPLADGVAVYDAGHADYNSRPAPARDQNGALRFIPATRVLYAVVAAPRVPFRAVAKARVPQLILGPQD